MFLISRVPPACYLDLGHKTPWQPSCGFLAAVMFIPSLQRRYYKTVRDVRQSASRLNLLIIVTGDFQLWPSSDQSVSRDLEHGRTFSVVGWVHIAMKFNLLHKQTYFISMIHFLNTYISWFLKYVLLKFLLILIKLIEIVRNILCEIWDM